MKDPAKAATQWAKKGRPPQFLKDPAVQALGDISGRRLLAAMVNPDRASRVRVGARAGRTLGLDGAPQLPATLARATRAVGAAKQLGLTVSFKKVRILEAEAGGFDWGRGEVFVVASILDGSGTALNFQTRTFEAIHDGDYLPLGSGGMLVGAIKNPRWFVDIHAVIAESDSDVRELGKAIESARKQSGLGKIAQGVGKLAAFDPTAISKVLGAVDVFLSLLSGILSSNGDDHIATVHDFYLAQQGFGAGRHPPDMKQLLRFQGAQLAYRIDVVEI